MFDITAVSRSAASSQGQALDEHGVQRAEARLDELVDTCHVVLDVEPVKALAARLLQLHPLRAFHALQVGAALHWAEQHPQGRTLHTLDRRSRSPPGVKVSSSPTERSAEEVGDSQREIEEGLSHMHGRKHSHRRKPRSWRTRPEFIAASAHVSREGLWQSGHSELVPVENNVAVAIRTVPGTNNLIRTATVVIHNEFNIISHIKRVVRCDGHVTPSE